MLAVCANIVYSKQYIIVNNTLIMYASICYPVITVSTSYGPFLTNKLLALSYKHYINFKCYGTPSKI